MTQAIKSLWRDNAIVIMGMMGFAVGIIGGWFDLKSDQRIANNLSLDNSQRITNLNQRLIQQDNRLIIVETRQNNVLDILKDQSKKTDKILEELKQHEINTNNVNKH